MLDELTNVGQELDSNRNALDLALFFHRTAAASIQDFARRIDDAGDEQWLILPDTILMSTMIFVPSYDPSTGALDALIADGRLSQLRDPELRRILAGFRTAVEDVREDELAARRAYVEH